MLTDRWTPLEPHPQQARLYKTSTARFRVVPAGRRSGKTELAKRFLVKKALLGTDYPTPRFFAAAPTRDQAKRIYWDDLKKLVPDQAKRGSPSESELVIQLITGSLIYVIGMDKPERIEGSPWDGGILDEYANMKPQAWGAHVRPALSDRRGWCWLIGVPEGRNHYYDTYRGAQEDTSGEWETFHWKSAEILPAEEVEAAKQDLDELTYLQEYEASFVNFQGRAYYAFSEETHCAPLAYDPAAPLIFCFDFNVAPGVAAVCQEQELPTGETGTGVIGEVWIPQNSKTPAVCRKLIQDWGDHKGRVICYGDATGGASGSAKVDGSDWDLIRDELRPVFGDKLSFRVPKHNPAERARVNAVNTRLRTQAGDVRLMVDQQRAPHVVRDFEGVRVLEGGSGELDKKTDPKLTHITDALGYYVVYEFPTRKKTGTVKQVSLHGGG
jgi:hypothetical protein